MKLMFISVKLELVNEYYLTKLRKPVTNKLSQSLVYGIDDDVYFISDSVGESTEREIVCNSQEEFMQKVEQVKLLKLLK